MAVNRKSKLRDFPKKFSDTFLEVGGPDPQKVAFRFIISVFIFSILVSILWERLNNFPVLWTVMVIYLIVSILAVAEPVLKCRVRFFKKAKLIQFINERMVFYNEAHFNQAERVLWETSLFQEKTEKGTVVEGRQLWAVSLVINGQPFLVIESESEEATRKLAEDIARMVGIPMENRTGQAVKVETIETLDMPLLEKFRKEKVAPGIPDEVDIEEAFVYEEVDKGYRIYPIVKKGGFLTNESVIMSFISIPLAITVIVFAIMYSGNPFELWSFNILSAITALAIIGTFLLLLKDTTYKEELLIEPGHLKVQQKTIFGKTGGRFPVDELEMVRIDMTSNPHISLDTDKKLHYFGFSVTPRKLPVLARLIEALIWKTNRNGAENDLKLQSTEIVEKIKTQLVEEEGKVVLEETRVLIEELDKNKLQSSDNSSEAETKTDDNKQKEQS
ncbi:MAG: hypothetical protein ACLFQV_01775 [Vulcanimicrobiota bacterium]